MIQRGFGLERKESSTSCFRRSNLLTRERTCVQKERNVNHLRKQGKQNVHIYVFV